MVVQNSHLLPFADHRFGCEQFFLVCSIQVHPSGRQLVEWVKMAWVGVWVSGLGGGGALLYSTWFHTSQAEQRSIVHHFFCPAYISTAVHLEGQMGLAVHRHLLSGTISIYCCRFKTENRKWKSRQFSLIRLPCGHCANGGLSFVCFFTKKQMEVIRLQRDLPVYGLSISGI
jgi:hypothetical protein